MRKVSFSTRVAAGAGALFVAGFSLFLADRASSSSSSQPAPSATTVPAAQASPSTPDAGGTVATAPTSPPQTLPPVSHVHTRSRGS